MINIAFHILSVFTFVMFTCNNRDTDDEPLTGYNLDHPDAVLILPDYLHEISGLTAIGSNTVACIQDEHGIVFIYDILINEIKDYLNFHINGDYEGIARVGNKLYILRSDGVLFEITDFLSDDFNLDFYDTGIPAKDNEGLCYDQDNGRLLIACKGKAGKGDESKDKRLIYAFDLKKKKAHKQPAFEMDLKEIVKFALHNKIKLPTKKNKKDQEPKPILKFRTSDICIHPVTKELFLISAEDHLLFVFNMQGEIEQIAQLNPEMFIQPEGLTFFENGDMLISNEGQDKKPTILRFNYRKN